MKTGLELAAAGSRVRFQVSKPSSPASALLEAQNGQKTKKHSGEEEVKEVFGVKMKQGNLQQAAVALSAEVAHSQPPTRHTACPEP